MIDESESWNNETLERQSHQNIKVQKDTFEHEAVDAEVIETEIDFNEV